MNLGAIIGGTIGGFAALSATGFGIFFVRRKLKKNKAKQISVTSDGPGLDEKDGKGNNIYQHLAQSELPDHSLAEMSHPPQELDGSSVKHETSASPAETRRSVTERGVQSLSCLRTKAAPELNTS